MDLLDEKLKDVLRSYTVESDRKLSFPYLKEGRYCLRITSDLNRNGVVDTGNLLEKRQPEQVKFVLFRDGKFLEVPPSAEIDQEIDIQKLFADD